MTTITHPSEIQVGRPLDRDVIRDVDEGFLVTCHAMHCHWQGLFLSTELAEEAVDAHYDHEVRHGQYHHGQRNHVVIELLDARTALATDQSNVSDLEHEKNRYTPLSEENPTFPRTTGDVTNLVETGDVIDTSGPRRGKVWRVTETRSLGLPTWTIIFVEEDYEGWPENRQERRRDCKWLNEMVAYDGQLVMRYAGRVYETHGQANDYQNLLTSYEKPA